MRPFPFRKGSDSDELPHGSAYDGRNPPELLVERERRPIQLDGTQSGVQHHGELGNKLRNGPIVSASDAVNRDIRSEAHEPLVVLSNVAGVVTNRRDLAEKRVVPAPDGARARDLLARLRASLD